MAQKTQKQPIKIVSKQNATFFQKATKKEVFLLSLVQFFGNLRGTRMGQAWVFLRTRGGSAGPLEKGASWEKKVPPPWVWGAPGGGGVRPGAAGPSRYPKTVKK